MMGSMVWADGGMAGKTERTATATASAGPPIRLSGLLDQMNALMERVGHVTSGIVPLRKIQRRVDPARDLAEPAGRHSKRTPHRIRPERAAEARHGRVRRDAGGGGGAEGVRHVLTQIPHPAEVEPERELVLISLGCGGI